MKKLLSATHVALPSWAHFHLELGRIVGSQSRGHQRLVVGLALPTRVFAPVLVGTGIVAARIQTKSKLDQKAHFDSICTLFVGAPVYLEVRGRSLRAQFRECTTQLGERWAKIYVPSSGETHFVAANEAFRVLVPDTAATNKGNELPSRIAIQKRRFLRHAFGRDALVNITRESRLDCVLVGRKSVLSEEAAGFVVTTRSRTDPNSFFAANLKHVLRVRRLLGPGQPYRSEIVSTSIQRVPSTQQLGVSHTVIFDGTSGFVKWRHLWPDSHWIVIMDLTEPRLTEAAEIVNALYRDKAIGNRMPLSLPPLEGRVELIAFRVPLVAGSH